MIGGTRQIVIEDNQRARSKTTGFLQIKVSQKGLGKSTPNLSIKQPSIYLSVANTWKCSKIIVRFFNSVSTCISERVFSHLEGTCSDCKQKKGSHLTL